VGEATWALAVLHPSPRPCASPPAFDDPGPDAGREPKPPGAAGLGDPQREAIREIVCDMLIAAAVNPKPPAAKRSGGRHG